MIENLAAIAAKQVVRGVVEHTDQVARWTRYLAWAQACWQGDVSQVIAEPHQGLEPSAQASLSEASRALLQRTVTYLTHNQPRMAYPR